MGFGGLSITGSGTNGGGGGLQLMEWGGGQRKSKKAHCQIKIIKNMIIIFSVSEAQCSYLALLFQPQNVLILFLF